MEDEKMRELNPEEMEMINGGASFGLYKVCSECGERLRTTRTGKVICGNPSCSQYGKTPQPHLNQTRSR